MSLKNFFFMILFQNMWRGNPEEKRPLAKSRSRW
jgi:hypothetical protein